MLILIDGVNGSGKDYCIDKLAKYCADNNITYTVTSIKDVMDVSSSKNKLVKRTETAMTYEDMIDVYIGQINLINKMKALLDSFEVVIVNRHLPSFYVYQHKLVHHSEVFIPLNMVKDLANTYLKELKHINYKNILLEEDMDTIVKRLKMRDKRVNKDKVASISNCYELYKLELGTLFANTIYLTSSEFNPEALF